MAAPIKVDATHLPPKRTKGARLLLALLRGEKLDPGTAFEKYNLTTMYARASELRKLGWPIGVIYKPHPKQIGEEYPVYGFDDHFLRWVGDRAGQDVDPTTYEHQAGRGKFRV